MCRSTGTTFADAAGDRVRAGENSAIDGAVAERDHPFGSGVALYVRSSASRIFFVVDKFASVDWRLGSTGAPLLVDSAASVEGEILSHFSAGDHEAFSMRAVRGVTGGHAGLLTFRSAPRLHPGDPGAARSEGVIAAVLARWRRCVRSGAMRTPSCQRCPGRGEDVEVLPPGGGLALAVKSGLPLRRGEQLVEALKDSMIPSSMPLATCMSLASTEL